VTTFGHEQSEARELLQYTSPRNTNSERIVEDEDSAHIAVNQSILHEGSKVLSWQFLNSDFICGFDLAVLP